MKILSLEAVDMGVNQDEIAEKCEDYIWQTDFKTADEFYAISDNLVVRACKELGWHSVPQNGGLEANWDPKSGNFEPEGKK